MEFFSIVLHQILIFILYGLMGFTLVKTRVVDRAGLNTLSRVIAKLALPLLIFTNTLNGTTRGEFLSALPVVLYGTVQYGLLFLLALGMALGLRLKGDRKNLFRVGSMFGNVGFMGIPILSALFPQTGLLYIALFTVPDQLLLWTLGLTLVQPEGKNAALTTGQRIKKMVNPVTVAVILAVAGLLSGIQLPEVVNSALTKTGAMATPLAMIFMGGMFALIDIRKYLRQWEFYAKVVGKMCLAPLVLTFLFGLLPFVPRDLAVTLGILCAMPTMPSFTMLVQTQGGDSEYCAGMTIVTTLCSIVTLPLVCSLLG